MVKNDPTTGKGEQTRSQIFESALELFREKGFDSTTMQDIAAHAGVVKSAAYYYFPGKEAIIQTYYETVQAEQERLCEKVFAQSTDLKVRLATAMHSKFELAKNDRRLLGWSFVTPASPNIRSPVLGEGQPTSAVAAHRFSGTPLQGRSCLKISRSFCLLLCGLFRWACW